MRQFLLDLIVKKRDFRDMRRQPAVTAILTLALLSGAGTACQPSPPPEHPARVAPTGKAQLPPTPDLQPILPPDRYPDGAYSVRGLLGAQRGSVKGEIVVRGVVATLHPCSLSEKVCKPAPYLHLTDGKTGLGKRLLVGGERDLDARKILLGQEVTLKGSLGTGTDDGTYFAPQGMLLLTPLPPPDPATATPPVAGAH